MAVTTTAITILKRLKENLIFESIVDGVVAESGYYYFTIRFSKLLDIV